MPPTKNPDDRAQVSEAEVLAARLLEMQKAIGDCPPCFRALHAQGVFSLTLLEDAAAALTRAPGAGVSENLAADMSYAAMASHDRLHTIRLSPPDVSGKSDRELLAEECRRAGFTYASDVLANPDKYGESHWCNVALAALARKSPPPAKE